MFNQTQFAQLAYLAEAGVEITVLAMDRYYVGGFYKSDRVVVDFTRMVVEARYNETTEFTEEDDLATVLADLNREWQHRSAERADFWKEPTTEWAKVYELLDNQ